MKKNAQEMVKKIAAIIQRIYGKKGSFIYRVAVPFASKIWGAKEATAATKKILIRKQRPYLRAVIKCHKNDAYVSIASTWRYPPPPQSKLQSLRE